MDCYIVDAGLPFWSILLCWTKLWLQLYPSDFNAFSFSYVPYPILSWSFDLTSSADCWQCSIVVQLYLILPTIFV